MKIELSSNDIKDFNKMFKGDIIIKAERNNQCLLINNDSLQICKHVNMNIYEEGTVCISENLLQLVQDNKNIAISDNKIQCGTREIKYNEKYQVEVNKVDVENKVPELNYEEFKELFSVNYAVATNNTRPILEAVAIVDSDFVALDGYRMSIRKK